MTATLDEENTQRRGCGIIGRYPIISILFLAACGIGLGIGLSYWQPEDAGEVQTKVEGENKRVVSLEESCNDDLLTVFPSSFKKYSAGLV